MENVRAIAWEILNKQTELGQYSNIALDTALKRHMLTSPDKGLLTAIVYGTLERKLTLDYWIDALSSRDGLENDVRNLLRMGLYQLAYLDRVPDHAAVNETVNLAPKRVRGFVNAVLREFLRRKGHLEEPSRENPADYLSVHYSFGKELCEKLLDVYGLERTESILEAFCRHTPVTLRTNTLRISRGDLCAELQGEETRFSPVGVKLPNFSVASDDGFERGDFFVQDEASQLCVEALDVQEGMTVLDTCACPGSKSFGIAVNMKNTGKLISCDLHKNKLSLVESGAKRLGITILETEERDARICNPDWVERFDRVLCDVPCSGFGVCGKKPELRYKNPADSAALPKIQSDILETSANYLKKGGKLVYSTCTVLPEENHENIAKFLAKHGEFSLLEEKTLFPDTDGTDGFYFAVLTKR